MDRFGGLFVLSKLSSRGQLSLLLEPFAVGSRLTFMPVESQRFAVRAASHGNAVVTFLAKICFSLC